MNRKKRRKLTAYLLALVMIFSCFGQSTGMAADYQAESKSAAVQSGESEIATGDAVTTATAATIEPTITPAENRLQLRQSHHIRYRTVTQRILRLVHKTQNAN